MYAIRRTLAVFCLVIIFAAVPLVVKIMLGIPALFILLLDFEEFNYKQTLKNGGQQK
ncbi:MAG TPA: hypothetical protein PK268_04355 [Enterococcus sp.]|mgnify:CR=1 FL=1|nr:hypothetical protein [Enterococcus sp.]HPR81121.1 hypothetical protein [Enterococcus sp.]